LIAEHAAVTRDLFMHVIYQEIIEPVYMRVFQDNVRNETQMREEENEHRIQEKPEANT
jgi:hypothetical protein